MLKASSHIVNLESKASFSATKTGTTDSISCLAFFGYYGNLEKGDSKFCYKIEEPKLDVRHKADAKQKVEERAKFWF